MWCTGPFEKTDKSSFDKLWDVTARVPGICERAHRTLDISTKTNVNYFMRAKKAEDLLKNGCGQIQADFNAWLRELFVKLRRRIPGLVLRTSVITGLPGEGEEEFAELCEFLKEQRLERVGAFPFSPEEGTPAAEMEFVDSEIAQQRAQQIELIQSRIMDEYNASMQGKTVTALVDGYDEEMEQFYGRTYADSPEIDSRVWIASQEALVEGTFIQIYIDGVADGELSGYALED